LRIICLFISLSLFIFRIGFSQEESGQKYSFQRKNSFGLEAGGYHVLASASYERIILNGNRLKTSVSGGLGYVDYSFALNELISFKKHHLELSGAAILNHQLFMHESADTYFTGRIAYRYQKPDGRFILLAGMGPVVLGADKEAGPELILWIWPFISCAWAF
jgi:hypothetical protein